MSIDLVIRLVAILLAALATGGLMVNWIGLARAMARVSSASVYTEFHQATNRTFDPYMPIVVCGALFGGIALAVVSSGVNSASHNGGTTYERHTNGPRSYPNTTGSNTPSTGANTSSAGAAVPIGRRSLASRATRRGSSVSHSTWRRSSRKNTRAVTVP